MKIYLNPSCLINLIKKVQMPNYIYQCSECSHIFEEFKTIAKYNEPLREPCPSCLHIGYISRLISGASLGESTKLEMTKGFLKPTTEFNEILKNIIKMQLYLKMPELLKFIL